VNRKTTAKQPENNTNAVRECTDTCSLVELAKIRISQINDCKPCTEQYIKPKRRAKDERQRIFWLDAWTDTSLFTLKEQAALAWTEAVTRLPENKISDDLYLSVREFLSEQQLNSLTSVIRQMKERYHLQYGRDLT